METGDSQPSLSPVLFDELMVEILSRLPVKSLLQFRCVSKSWKSLISNPQFVKLHLDKSPKTTNLVLTLESYPFEYDECDIRAICCSKQSLLENPSLTVVEDGCYRLKDTYWLVGSCNGLVCFRKSHSIRNNFTKCWVRFWNPAMRLRSKKSPCLHVNSSSYSTRFGFGYDNSSDTYKVVAVILGSQNTTVKVYIMGDNCWRKILSFPAFPLLDQINGMYISGTLNWLAFDKPGSSHEGGTVTVDQLGIFSLDLEKETYKQFLLPGGLDEVLHVDDDDPRLGVFRDHLCFSHYYEGNRFVIWQMEEFGVEKSWTQLINVSYQHLQIDHDYKYFPLFPLCTSEDGDVVVLANNGDYEAILYHWKDNRVERIDIPNNEVWMTDAKDYVQSLVLPY